MKSLKTLVAAAASVAAVGTAFAQSAAGSGYSQPGAQAPVSVGTPWKSGSGYSQPGAQSGATPVVTTTPAPASSSDGMSNGIAVGTSGTGSSEVIGYVVPATPENTPINRDDVKREAAEMNALRATATGESPDYPQRTQRMLGTANY